MFESEFQIGNWGMHLTPKAPRYDIRALEGYSPTLGGLESASPSGFKFSRAVPRRGAMSPGRRPHDLRQMMPLARRLPQWQTTRYGVVGS